MSSPTRIAIIGYGQMGRELAQHAPQMECEVSAICDVDTPFSTLDPAIYDVAIDFTQPEAVLSHVRTAADHQRNLVIGTTGWLENVDVVRAHQESSGIGLLYGSNFSMGIHVFLHIVSRAASMIDALDTYDVMIHEWHHRRKKDSPSGTALSTADVVLQHLQRKNRISTETEHAAIDPAALHVTSTRGGEVVGRHMVTIDGPQDSIEITHTAKNRSGFAIGALAAARWLDGRHGFYTFADVFGRLAEGPAR